MDEIERQAAIALADKMEPFKPCYMFDPATGEFIGEGRAYLSPLEHDYPCPQYGCWYAPQGNPGNGYVWQVKRDRKGWNAVQDNRGVAYTLNGELHTMDTLGPLPEGADRTLALVEPEPVQVIVKPPVPADDLQLPAEQRMQQRVDAAYAASTDWVLQYYERGEPVPEPLVKYRQELRDLPKSPAWPDVTLPNLPEITL